MESMTTEDLDCDRECVLGPQIGNPGLFYFVF